MIREGVELLRLWRKPLLTSEAIEQHQERRLKRLVRHAYDHVPFYRSRFNEAGVKPSQIRTLSDLALLPICDKEDLREVEPSQLIADNISRDNCRSVLTSGSTGEPFRVLYTAAESRQRRALEIRCLLRIGVRPWDRVLFFGPEGPFPKRFYNHLGLFRLEVIPAFLSLTEQLGLLKASNPDIFWVYPAVLRSLLHALGGRLSRIARPKILITSAETLPIDVRDQIATDLGEVELFNFYGSMELGRIAWECTSHRGLHLNADHLILECLAGDKPCPPGKIGSTVITCLNANAMPFIRYRLGDLTSFKSQPCDCGSAFPLIEAPQGRSDVPLLLPNGGSRSFWPITFILRRRLWIRQFHLIQESPERYVLELRTQTGVVPPELEPIRRQILQFLGASIELHMKLVEQISKPTSKFSRFSSRILPEKPRPLRADGE